MDRVNPVKRRVWIIGSLAMLLIVALYQGGTAKVREITGTVTSLDPTARTASLVFAHPKTGEPIELSGQVPLECDIRIDDKPAQIAELKVGDVVQVRATIHNNAKITANRIRVTRGTTP